MVDVVDYDALPSVVHAVLRCATCTKFPRRVAFDVERVAGSWRLRSLRAL